jgi:hypothetical protein
MEHVSLLCLHVLALRKLREILRQTQLVLPEEIEELR